MLRAGSAMGILAKGLKRRGTVRQPFDSADQSFSPSGPKFHPRARTRAGEIRGKRGVSGTGTAAEPRPRPVGGPSTPTMTRKNADDDAHQGDDDARHGDRVTTRGDQ